MEFYGTKNYISTQDLSVAVNAAINLEKPLVVKGEPGTGKTELARQVAKSLKLEIKPVFWININVYAPPGCHHRQRLSHSHIVT